MRFARCFLVVTAAALTACVRQAVQPPAPALEIEFKAAAKIAICTADGNDPKNVVLNHLKNRADPPADSDFLGGGTFTPTQFLAAMPDLDSGSDVAPKHRYDFTDAMEAQVDEFEPHAASVTGYFLDAVEEGGESANCGTELGNDWHTWLWSRTDNTVADRKALRDYSVVAEVTPASQQAHSNWTSANIRKLAKDKAKVRVTGWLLFDPEHFDQVGKTRASRWEIHPITSIEVFQQGQWQEIN